MSTKRTSLNSFDAIVIGSGISGGWAAMELCKKGFKTLLLDRGRNVEHIKDYPTANSNPWDFENGMNNTLSDIERDPIQSIYYRPDNKHFFVRDQEQPYIQEKPFSWLRGDQVGGRSLIWGRQCYRLSDLDFEANLKEGIAVDWPIRYRDIASWYSYVESFIGVSGQKEGLSHFPDGEFMDPMELNCIENHVRDTLLKKSDNRLLTIARVANLTRGWNGRGPCMNRNLCTRGCPFGGYFSSNSSTIPIAMATGNLTLRPYSIVSEILYDEIKARAKGVSIIDKITHERHEFYAKVIFVNASTIATTGILLNSISNRFENGLGNDSGQIGHNLMDHHSSAGAYGIHNGFEDFYYKGRRPSGFVIPRFQNLSNTESLEFKRGYQIMGHGERMEWMDKTRILKGFGRDFKKGLTSPGPWTIWMAGWGECLPEFNNKVTLERSKLDQWGLPLLNVDFEFGTNEKIMMKNITSASFEILDQAGFSEIESFNYGKPGGSTVHEMGTARMGHDPKTSVLNLNNQMHDVKNIYITDGSCMTSSGCQNPSLTYMALTARACAHAEESLKKGII